MPAPDPDGDVVPGDPPVPITVWYLPRPLHGPVTSAALTQRLIANYTHPGALVVDLTTSVPSPVPPHALAELIITQWPPSATSPDTATDVSAGSSADVSATSTRSVRSVEDTAADPSGHLAACAARLMVGGCVAVVVAAPAIHDLLGVLVTAGHAAALAYLQHIVVVHHLPTPPGDTPDRAAVPRLPDGGRHPRVHTDLLLFRRTRR